MKKAVNSDFGGSYVIELVKMGWFGNCWAKLSPFPESTHNNRGQG